jgi:leader peptidase (prepilin peptidase)/N-methyltransferase
VSVVLAGLVGLVFGSFASVVAHRVPRREAFVRGRSRCPHCAHALSARENVPLVSYALQRGRCRHCGARISARYPLIEAATGILFALACARFGASPTAVVYAAFFWVLVVLSVIDLEHRLLPNRVVAPAFVGGWIGLLITTIATGDPGRLATAAIGSLLFGGFIFVLAFVTAGRGMGYGDVKLAFVLGTFLGYLDAPGLVLVGMFMSFLVGSVTGVAAMWLTKQGRKMQVPFGPSLALGTVIAICVGRPLLDAYLGP